MGTAGSLGRRGDKGRGRIDGVREKRWVMKIDVALMVW
jgi:hypothetical protein